MLTRMRIRIHVISNSWCQNVDRSLQKRANECIFTAKVDNMTIQRLMSKEMSMRMRIWVSFTFTFKWENVRNSLQRCVNDLIFTVLVDSTCIYVYELIKKNSKFFWFFSLFFQFAFLQFFFFFLPQFSKVAISLFHPMLVKYASNVTMVPNIK